MPSTTSLRTAKNGSDTLVGPLVRVGSGGITIVAPTDARALMSRCGILETSSGSRPESWIACPSRMIPGRAFAEEAHRAPIRGRRRIEVWSAWKPESGNRARQICPRA